MLEDGLVVVRNRCFLLKGRYLLDPGDRRGTYLLGLDSERLLAGFSQKSRLVEGLIPRFHFI